MNRASPPRSSARASAVRAAAGAPLLAALGAVAALSFVTAASAAADDEIGWSRDGQRWDDWSPLFDADVRWVPGERRQETFYVRNQGPTAAALTVEFVIDDPDALVEEGHLELRARLGDGPWRPLEGELAALPPVPLDEGQATPVDVEASFAWDAPNATMNRNVALDVRATLSGTGSPEQPGPPQQPAPPQPGPPGAPGPGGLLPGTGGAFATVMWLAALAVGGGLALVVRSRRAQGES